MTIFADQVFEDVSGTPGTGTITLSGTGAAIGDGTTGRTFAAALGANAAVKIRIIQGSAWEVCDSTYTHSGTTLSRGTLRASSTGSRVDFGSGAKVMLVSDAHSLQNAGLATVIGPDAATSMQAGFMYACDVSGWGANRVYTLPATAAVGDRVGIVVSSGSATRRVAITAASGDTLNGIAGGTAWTRLQLAGEMVICRCVEADSAWVVESEFQTRGYTHIRNNGSTTQTLGAGSTTQVTTALTTVVDDPCGWWDATNKRLQPSKPGVYQFSCGFQKSGGSGNVCQASIWKNGSADTEGMTENVANGFPIAEGPIYLDGESDYADFRVYVTSAIANLSGKASGVFFKAYYLGAS